MHRLCSPQITFFSLQKGWTSCWLARTPISGRHACAYVFLRAVYDQMSPLAIELLFRDKRPHHYVLKWFVLQLTNLLNWKASGYTKECQWCFAKKNFSIWANNLKAISGLEDILPHNMEGSPRGVSQDLVSWAFPGSQRRLLLQASCFGWAESSSRARSLPLVVNGAATKLCSQFRCCGRWS